MDNIQWGLLGNAVVYYQNKGYKYIETPWIVQNVMNMITTPHENLLTKIEGTTNSLVGSSEQGFLSMQMNDNLPRGKYVSCSPCFRNETGNDGLHLPYFMKVELYQTDDTSIDAMYAIIQDAEDFFHSVYSNGEGVGYFANGGTKNPGIKRIVTPEGVDINLNDIEIGSYGIRKFCSHQWICGTGLALPRFNQALRNGTSSFLRPYCDISS
jgi:hypothetical protein